MYLINLSDKLKLAPKLMMFLTAIDEEDNNNVESSHTN